MWMKILWLLKNNKKLPGIAILQWKFLSSQRSSHILYIFSRTFGNVFHHSSHKFSRTLKSVEILMSMGAVVKNGVVCRKWAKSVKINIINNAQHYCCTNQFQSQSELARIRSQKWIIGGLLIKRKML